MVTRALRKPTAGWVRSGGRGGASPGADRRLQWACRLPAQRGRSVCRWWVSIMCEHLWAGLLETDAELGDVFPALGW